MFFICMFDIAINEKQNWVKPGPVCHRQRQEQWLGGPEIYIKTRDITLSCNHKYLECVFDLSTEDHDEPIEAS